MLEAMICISTGEYSQLRKVISFFHFDIDIFAEKVRAHVTVTNDMSREEVNRANANASADEAAKAGAAEHRMPSDGELRCAAAEWSAWKGATQLAAALLEFWIPVAAREERLTFTRGPTPRGTRRRDPPASQDNFVTVGGHRVCERCLLRVRTAQGEKQAMWRACPGAALRIKSILEGNGDLYKPHRLQFSSSAGTPGLFCTSCGCYTSTIEQHLGVSCVGRPWEKGKQCISRYLKGLHPQAREGKRKVDASWTIDQDGGIMA